MLCTRPPPRGLLLRHPSALAARASLTPGSLECCPLLAGELRLGSAASAGASVDFGTSGHPGTGNFTTRETLTPFASLRAHDLVFLHLLGTLLSRVRFNPQRSSPTEIQAHRPREPSNPGPPHRAAPLSGLGSEQPDSPMRSPPAPGALCRAGAQSFCNRLPECILAPPPRLESHPLQILPPTHRTPPSLANSNPSPAPDVTRHRGPDYRGPGDKGWIAQGELVGTS